MRSRAITSSLVAFLGFTFFLGSASVVVGSGLDGELPWRQAGLSERQAAAHLLDRFAYGARPGQIEELLELGLANWVEGQLAGDLPGSVLDGKLTPLAAIALPQKEIVRQFSYDKSRLVQAAIDAGVITMKDYSGAEGKARLQAAVAALNRFAAERGMQPEKKLLTQLKAQKLLRAVYAESQLVEVLTDFWFNHFNVSVTSFDAQVYVLSYERDAIRPHVLGSFRQLLGASARHPAMLLYLGNARSVANSGRTTAFDLEIQELDRLSPGDNPSLRQEVALRLGWFGRQRTKPTRRARPGLNENYARELLELHTLGVDGGYRQRDVVEVARAFTGWTTFPQGGARANFEALLVTGKTAETARDMGLLVEDEFIFRADEHDSEAKTVLGTPLPPGRGIEDGEEVLDLLAWHPATRRRLARKLAIRFVSERPPQALVQRLEETWELTDGHLPELIRTLVRSPEFWSPGARRAKIKTPFELAASSLRALDAEISDAKELVEAIARMGQPLYAYSAPTGFPDRGDHWANVGPMLGRINFGMKLAVGKFSGVTVDLLKLLGKRRLDSLEEAVALYFPHLMPGRDPTVMLDLIGGDEGAEDGVAEGETPSPSTLPGTPASRSGGEAPPPEKLTAKQAIEIARATNRYAHQAVGMLIGSPEFQVK